MQSIVDKLPVLIDVLRWRHSWLFNQCASKEWRVDRGRWDWLSQSNRWKSLRSRLLNRLNEDAKDEKLTEFWHLIRSVVLSFEFDLFLSIDLRILGRRPIYVYQHLFCSAFRLLGGGLFWIQTVSVYWCKYALCSVPVVFRCHCSRTTCISWAVLDLISRCLNDHWLSSRRC